MSSFAIKPASQAQTFARVALTGPAGSGKTYSALLLARGLVGPTGRIAVIDTEASSSGAYRRVTEFCVLDFGAPYSPCRYVEAIALCEESKYDAIVIDSLSHAWAGEGGCLDTQGALADSGKGNSYTAWRKVTPEHNRLVETILTCRAHVIATMRVKTAYELVDDERGKKTPKKIGLAPIQRDGMDYEFTVVWDIDASHTCVATKDRTALFDGVAPARMTANHGARLAEWLRGGEAKAPMAPPVTPPVVDEPTPAPPPVAPPAQDPDVAALATSKVKEVIAAKGSVAAAKEFCQRVTGKSSSKDYTLDDVNKLTEALRG